MIENITQCQKQLQRLKSLGILLALDDYGTGFSSITHLKELPIDIIKIDRSLIDHVDRSPKNKALTAGIVEMAHRMGMKVIAEGVERQFEADIMRELNCDYLQGFLLSKPLSSDEFDRALGRNPVASQVEYGRQ